MSKKHMYLCARFMLKLEQMRGMERGFLRPIFMFPRSLALQRSIRSSLTASMLLGSSRMNGRVDLQHLSRPMVSILVFIRCPHSPWPHKERTHLAADDFPKEIAMLPSKCVHVIELQLLNSNKTGINFIDATIATFFTYLSHSRQLRLELGTHHRSQQEARSEMPLYQQQQKGYLEKCIGVKTSRFCLQEKVECELCFVLTWNKIVF